MTRYWYDCEFHEDGTTIDLISIGIVCEDGREYYAVNSEADWERIRANKWLCENVVPHLPLVGGVRHLAYGIGYSFHVTRRDTRVKPKWVIGNEVRDFLLAAPEPELWAWYGAYDHVALCQLWGRMIDLPPGIPMWTNDLKQEVTRLGNPTLPAQEDAEHDALADARHLRFRAEYLGLAS